MGAHPSVCCAQDPRFRGSSASFLLSGASNNLDFGSGATLDDKIEYLTDVEGNWEYFLRLVSRSSVLYWEGEEMGSWGPGELVMRESGVLVFGGDAVDKGPGDIRFVKTLLSLKRRYPTRVYILIGNRDINKLRFYAELASDEDGRRFTPYWDKNPVLYIDYIEKKGLKIGRLSTLRWMLECNMGAHTTFHTRKRELVLINGPGVTDEMVLESFVGSVDPFGDDPWMLELLIVGHLIVVIGDKLFTHAGIQEAALGLTPGNSLRADSVMKWASDLNTWKAEQLTDFCKRPSWHWLGDIRHRGGEDLISYGCPAAGAETVVYFNPFQNGNPVCFPTRVEDFLVNSGIAHVVSGHQPHGQSPAIVRHTRSELVSMNCDTSYSDTGADKSWNSADNRGIAISVVCFQGSNVHIEGRTCDGQDHGFTLHGRLEEANFPEVLVGMQLTDGSWIKTLTEDRKRVIAVFGHGFELKVLSMHPGQAFILLRSEYRERLANRKIDLRKWTLDWLSETRLQDEHAPNDDHVLSRMHIVEDYDREEFERADCYIFAIDGVVANLLPTVQATVVQKINKLGEQGKRVVFLSTNTDNSRQDLAERLESIGFKMTSRTDVITTGQVCAWLLKLAHIQRPFVLCSGRGILADFREGGITEYHATVDDKGKQKDYYFKDANKASIMNAVKQFPNPDAVIVGTDNSVTALKMAVASSYLKWSFTDTGHTKQLISCSLESDHFLGVTPSDFCKGEHYNNRRIRSVGSGSIANQICQMVEAGQEIINIGKPGCLMAEFLRSTNDGGLGLDFDRTIVVGHQLETDMVFARMTGMKSLLVLTGATGNDHLNNLERLRLQGPEGSTLHMLPTWVLPSVAEI